MFIQEFCYYSEQFTEKRMRFMKYCIIIAEELTIA